MKHTYILFFILHLSYIGINAQTVNTVIDHKGTIIETTNSVTTATTAPTTPPPLFKAISGSPPPPIPPHIWDGTIWQEINANTHLYGDLKHGFLNTDHRGWVLLNGRATSTLTATQQVQAALLGFTANLYNATDNLLIAKGAGNIGDLGGGITSIQITQQNLPNIPFTGTTTTEGNHRHSSTDFYSGKNSRRGANNPKRLLGGGIVSPRSTSINGSHDHTFTVSTGGTDTPIAIAPSYLQVNTFIFLGS